MSDKAKCPVCRRQQDVRGGKLVVHYEWTTVGKRELVKCAGSGRKP